MNKKENALNKIFTAIKKQKSFAVILLTLIVLGTLYLLVFEKRIVNFPGEKVEQIEFEKMSKAIEEEYNSSQIESDKELLKEKQSKNKKLTIKENSNTQGIIDKGKVYEDLSLVFYDKKGYHYVKADGVEHKYTHYDNDSYSNNFNIDRNIFVKHNNIYFAAMSDFDTNKKYLYAFYKENGLFKEKVIDEAKYYIDFMYVVGNKLFYKKREEIENSYESTWTICSYEFGGKSEEIYKVDGMSVQYCSEIDKLFCVKQIGYGGVYHYSLEMVDAEGIKLIEEYVNNAHIITTPEGIYYTTRGEGGALYFNNGNKVKLKEKAIINQAYYSHDYRFAYFETLEEKKVNLNDYLVLPDKNDEYYKSKIKDQNPEEFIYYDTSVYAACKGEFRKLADNAEIKACDDKIIITTYKNRKEKKRGFKEALELVRYKNNSVFTTGSESIANYLLYLGRDIEFNYIFDGDRGSRFNKGDSYASSSLPWLIKDDVLACNAGGIFAGKVKYEEVSNLYKLVKKDSENGLWVIHINIKNGKTYIYYRVQYKNSFSYDKARMDIYCYHDGKNELILENIEGARIAEDSEQNIYIIRFSGMESTIRQETLYKVYVDNDVLKKEVFEENVSNLKNYYTYDRTYDDIKNEGFYYDSSENSKSKIGESFNEDNPQSTILEDIDKSGLINLNTTINMDELQYRELSKEYVEGSKDYYQKTNVKVYNFYQSMGALYIDIEDELVLVDDNFGYGNKKLIVYDAHSDEYYYMNKIKKNTGRQDVEMQNIRLKIKDKVIDKKVIAKIKVEDPDYNYQLKYLGKLGEYYVWVDSDEKIFVGDDKGNIKEIAEVGNGNYNSTSLDDEFRSGHTCFFISLNSYENKLYYINRKTLNVIDEKLQSKKIADNVQSFVALQDEVLYISGGLFRYSNGKSVKLFDVDEMSLSGRHNDKKCYVYTKKSKYIKDVFYIDGNADNKKKASWESSKNYWLGHFGTLYIYENGKINKIIENVEYPTNRVLDYYRVHGHASMVDPYILTKGIVGSGVKINFDEFYKYCKDIDMTDPNENYKAMIEYKNSIPMYAYLINTQDIKKIELDGDFKIYDANNIIIRLIRNGIMEMQYEYKNIVSNIEFENTAKNNYDVIYNKNIHVIEKNYDGEKQHYDRVEVYLSENYLYDMFN